MPSRTFPLEPGGPPRVEIAWKMLWKDVQVRVDGATLGVIPDQAALTAGRDFQLPAGGVLRVVLARSMGLIVELQVTLDGRPLPGSVSDVGQRVKGAAGILYFIAGLNVVFGLVAVVFRVGLLQANGVGVGSIVEGVVYAGLALGTAKRSIVALGLGMALFAGDTVMMLAGAVQAPGGSPPVGGIVFRVFLFLSLIQGMRALLAARKAPAAV